MMRRWLGATPAARVARVYAAIVIALFALWPLLAYSDELGDGWRWTGADADKVVASAFVHGIERTPASVLPCIATWNEQVAPLTLSKAPPRTTDMRSASIHRQLSMINSPRAIRLDVASGACTAMVTDGDRIAVLRSTTAGWVMARNDVSIQALARHGGNVIAAADGTLQPAATDVEMPWRVRESGAWRQRDDGTYAPAGEPIKP
jgi:hypothetical protein